MSTSKVWIIIPTFNRQEILLECIADLKMQDYKNIQILVVDDSSSDNTLNIVHEKYPEIITLSGDGHRWWSGAMNLGLGYVMSYAAESDFFISFNDDVRVLPNYVSSLIECGIKHKSPSLVGSLAVDSNNTSKVVFCGTKINWKTGLWKGLTVPALLDGLEKIISDSLPGRGVLIPISAVKKIGFYDDKLFPQYFGDEDFALRAKSAGWDLIVSTKGLVYSHVLLTGIGRNKLSLIVFLRSLFSIKSPNQLSRRCLFILRHCPLLYIPLFLGLDCIKVATSFWRS
ncbi:MAG: glycosyltransferase family 2 protein [Burkholderiales bacterium]|nr:glycosyltransferase family 2 protein [Burkholderiales bacterium]